MEHELQNLFRRSGVLGPVTPEPENEESTLPESVESSELTCAHHTQV